CDIGMSEKEAIAAGTINAAKFLDADNKIGSISKGKDADLILTDKNPLDNIGYLSNKDNIEMVIREGRIIKNQLN
ncbi:amidohydrolase family protein, partial [Methanobrevibacter boviskoreani]|uniref:amidohydrolase family protein n=1 Tax=Methanobrevibacter boviskoreani TaxID=1348249 RepID=UPI0023F560F5